MSYYVLNSGFAVEEGLITTLAVRTLADGTGISFSDNGTTLTIACTVTQYTDGDAVDAVAAVVGGSVVYSGGEILLDGDEDSPGNREFYSTSDAGAKGWRAIAAADLPDLSGTYLTIAAAAAGYQPLDADLTAVAGLSSNGLVARTGSGTAAVRTLTGTTGRISVTNGDGVSGNPTLDLAAGAAMASPSGCRLVLGWGQQLNSSSSSVLPKWLTDVSIVIASGATVNATDEYIEFSIDPGWPTGTAVRSTATSSGLTAGTTYYVQRSLTTQVRYWFYTSRADARAATNRVNLTGSSYTGTIWPTEVSLVPYRHNRVMVEGVWRSVGNGVALTLVGLSTSTVYDVFAYWDGSAVVLESVAWSSTTDRGALELPRDSYGVLTKVGDSTRTYVGSIYLDSNGYCHDANGLRYLFNAYNGIDKSNMKFLASDASWASSSWRQLGGSGSGLNTTVLAGLPQLIDLHLNLVFQAGGSSTNHLVSIGYDSTSSNLSGFPITQLIVAASAYDTAHLVGQHGTGIGLHTYYALEHAAISTSVTFLGGGTRSNFNSKWRC